MAALIYLIGNSDSSIAAILFGPVLDISVLGTTLLGAEPKIHRYCLNRLT